MLKMQIFWTIEKMDTLDNKASRHNVIIGEKNALRFNYDYFI